MQWGNVIAEVDALEVSGRRDVDVRGVQYDSRRLSAGEIFVAMRGGTTDGNRYIDAALRQGAAAIVTDSRETFAELRERQPELALALVEHGRRALAEVSAAVFAHPELDLTLSAVTGTNGKTTTAFLVEQLLASAGRKSVSIGTIETRIAGVGRPSDHTTPESRDVLELFAAGVRLGCTEAVMEMSSHALEQERVWGLPVDVAIFTNLTQDHLDFHGTMEAYAAAKAKMFAGVGTVPPRVAVVNQDDKYAAEMVEAFGGETLMRYGMEGDYATHRAENVKLSLGETRFDFVTPDRRIAIRSPLSGRVNVYNLLAAMCAAMARGIALEDIAAATPTLQQVPGRFEIVRGSREAGFTVVVDYAHTDDALHNLIRLAREGVASGGRVITLFGCGGDRDRTKRPKMGLVAGRGSDLVVVTSDNPRSEEPMKIIEEALVGLRETGTEFAVEVDRRAAIEAAIGSARPGDIVLLAGKGHEKTQAFADRTVPFDDVAEAQRVIQKLQDKVRA